MLTIRIVWFHAVLILQDGEGDVLVRVAELLRQEISEDCSHGLGRRLIEAATESADHDGIVTLSQTNGEDGLDSLYKFLLFLSSERAALTLKRKEKSRLRKIKIITLQTSSSPSVHISASPTMMPTGTQPCAVPSTTGIRS